MKKGTIFALLALMVFGLVATAGLASAYRGDYTVNGPDFSEERHTEMEKAFDSLDYESWKELMTGRAPRVVEVVNEENFKTFVEAHEAGQNGDTETAQKLSLELGLNNGIGPKDGSGQRAGRGQGKAGQGMQHFVDSDNDGNCDNLGRK